MRQIVPVGAASIEVFTAGSGVRVAGTAHPMASMEAALPLVADATGGLAVCVNPRGVGGSSPPAGGEEESLERMADDLEAVRRALDVGRWLLWGMSGGSMIAQVYAHRHPAALEALILDSAGPCFAETLRDPGFVADRAAIAALPAAVLAFDARPWLGAIRAPTLVLGGTEDRVAPPAQLRALHEAIPGSRLALIEGAGHVPATTLPAEVTAVVRRFLDDL